MKEKSKYKEIQHKKSSLSGFPTFAVFYHIPAYHSAMLCCSLVLSFILLAFLSCLCLITLYSFQPHSCKILFLFSSCSCNGSHFSHTYSFLRVFTPLTLLSFLGCASFCASFHSGSLPYLFNFLYFITEFLGVYLQCCLMGIRTAILVYL